MLLCAKSDFPAHREALTTLLPALRPTTPYPEMMGETSDLAQAGSRALLFHWCQKAHTQGHYFSYLTVPCPATVLCSTPGSPLPCTNRQPTSFDTRRTHTNASQHQETHCHKQVYPMLHISLLYGHQKACFPLNTEAQCAPPCPLPPHRVGATAPAPRVRKQ